MTRDRKYVETFMARLAGAWRADPDSRFGQLTSNISRRANKSNARFDGLEEVSDLAFIHALDRRELEIARASEGSQKNPRPPDAVFDALMYETKVDYDRWAMKEFGRIGRDPTRIGPFIERWSEFWNEHSEHRFGELLIEVLPPRPGSGRRGPHMRGELRLIEDDVLLELIADPEATTAREISERYIRRGPLGELLDRLEGRDD